MVSGRCSSGPAQCLLMATVAPASLRMQGAGGLPARQASRKDIEQVLKTPLRLAGGARIPFPGDPAHAFDLDPAALPVPDPARHGGAHVHRVLPGAGHRPVRQRHHRLGARPERAAPGTPQGLAGRDRRRPGRPARAASRAPHRPLRHQPHHPPVQRQAGAGPGGLRRPSRAAGHHQPARAPGNRPAGARLGRQGLSRRHHPAARGKSPGGRRGRPDRGRRRRRRPCRHAQPLRAGQRDPPHLRRPHRPVRRHDARARHPGRAGHGRRPGLHRHALHRQHRGQRLRGIQEHDRARPRRRHRLHAFLHRHSGQLPEGQHTRRRPGSGTPGPGTRGQHELRFGPEQGLARHLGGRPGHRRHRRRAAHGRHRGPAAGRVPAGPAGTAGFPFS